MSMPLPMFRLIEAPPSAFIGNNPIRLVCYSDSLESEVEATLGALQGAKVNQYPPMLVCTLVLDGTNAPSELERCYLYSERPGNDITLNFTFGSREGIWKENVAIGAAYRELSALPAFPSYQRKFEIDHDETTIFFTRYLKESSRQDLHAVVTATLNDIRKIVAAINAKLFGFTWKAEYETDEAAFTKEVVIPLLRNMGFEGVRYNHGISECGRDVLFADLDKFSNVRHYAAQVKAGGITASNGTLLNQLIVQIDDAFTMPVKGPGKSKQFHVSDVFVICSGKISSGAVERLNQKLDPRLFGSVHFLDVEDILHLAHSYLEQQCNLTHHSTRTGAIKPRQPVNSNVRPRTMPVYFVLDTNTSQVKIGRGSDIRRRVRNLQTGNPSPLQLMGWIKVENDNEVERRLHARYQEYRGIGEWFYIGPTEVLEELKREHGFVPTPKDAFEIVGYDRDGIPEYMGVCEWADFEFYECCPFCGCFCGMHLQEASGMYHCVNCGAFTNLEDFNGEPHDMV